MNAPSTAQVAELFTDVDDLIRRIADTEDPEIRKMRARVYTALVVAKAAFESSANQGRRPLQLSPLPLSPLQLSEEYLQEQPAPEVGVALLLGLGLALVASARQ
jgi:ElaB/YqjD/DUF883 family membrane-anchored ribosome-binding protein